MKFWFLTVASLLILPQLRAQDRGANQASESTQQATAPMTPCSYPGASPDAQIAAALQTLNGGGSVDATCYGHRVITMVAPIILQKKQGLTFSPDTVVRPASDEANIVEMFTGAELNGLTVDLSTHPHYSGQVVHVACTTGGVDTSTTVNRLTVRGADSPRGTALGMNCDQKLKGLAFVNVEHLSSFGLADPIVLRTSAPGAWINGNNFHDLHLIGPASAPITGISLVNTGLEIRGNVFTGLQIEGNGVKGSFGINVSNSGSQMIRANLFEGSVWDVTNSWHPQDLGVMGNIVIGNLDSPPVDNGSNTIENLLAVHPGVETQELTLARHLDQAGPQRFGGTCTMNRRSSCSFLLLSPFSETPICIATVQGSDAIPAACTVSGITVTITAGSSNTKTWGAMLIGNPN